MQSVQSKASVESYAVKNKGRNTVLQETVNNKKNFYIEEDIRKMRHYETLELRLLILEDEDVLTASAEFTEEATGDNGVWFPGNPNGKEEAWKQ